MLFSGCVLCAIRSPVVTPGRDLMRSMYRTAPRVLRSPLGPCRTDLLSSVHPTYHTQNSVHPTYHTQKSSGFFSTNSRNFSLVTQCSWKKYNVVYGKCVFSDRYIYTGRDTKSQNCQSYRSVFEMGCCQRSNLLLNSDMGFRNGFINIGDQVRIQLRCYSAEKPNTFPATDSENKIDADKQTITDLQQGRILTVPNVLTMFRMVMAPVLGYLVIEEAYSLACGVFVVAGLTDMLDGFIARNFKNQTSALGSFIDPLADKLLISVLFVSLTAVDLLPVALTALVLVRDVCLMSGGFYVRYISLDPRPKSLQEFFDITNPSAKLQPTFLSKVNTAVQLSVVAFTLAAPVFGYVDHPALQALWYLTAATTLVSGVGYIFAKDTFKLLQKSRKNT